MNGTEKLIELIAARDLLAPEVLKRLRDQLAAAEKPVSPQVVVKRLVDTQHLTAAQGKRLLDEVGTGGKKSAGAKSAPRPSATSPPAEATAAAKPTDKSTDKPTVGAARSSLLEEELGLGEDGGGSGA
jgi:hypothetical protein